MDTRIATQHFLNPETQRALLQKPLGYVQKEENTRDRVSLVRRQHKPERVALLHRGENPDGGVPEVAAWLSGLACGGDLGDFLGTYPESQPSAFRVKLAALHGVHPEWIMITGGLDPAIDMIAASFVAPRDRVLVTDPGFFLFEEYSARYGGIPVALQLSEKDGFAWTEDTLRTLADLMKRVDFKVIWLANPNNPTGRLMDRDLLELVVSMAREHWITVVVDEAYGEYTDPTGRVRSATSLLASYENLVVLRTFSKAWGLAGMRIGAVFTGNPVTLAALQVHRPYFPVSRLSLEMAALSLDHLPWLDQVRQRARQRQAALAKGLGGIPGINLVCSDTGIAMLRCLGMTARTLMARLEERGILVAPVNGTGPAAQQYVRVSFGEKESMDYLGRVVRGLYRDYTEGTLDQEPVSPKDIQDA